MCLGWARITAVQRSFIGWKGEKKYSLLLLLSSSASRGFTIKRLCALVPLGKQQKKLFRFAVFCFFFSSWRECCQVNNKYNMQIKIIKRESEGSWRERWKKTKIYSNNTNEYFVFFVDTRAEKNAKRIENKSKKMSEKNLFNIKEFSTYRTLYYFSSVERNFVIKRFRVLFLCFPPWQTLCFPSRGVKEEKKTSTTT